MFNGEIYNYRAVRNELEAAGRMLSSRPATPEVLLQSYRHWGEAMFSRLRGMYAFALWDKARGDCSLAVIPMASSRSTTRTMGAPSV